MEERQTREKFQEESFQISEIESDCQNAGVYARKKKIEEEKVDTVSLSASESEPALTADAVESELDENIVFFDLERSGGPDDSEIIQLAFSNCKKAVNLYVLPEGGIDKIASNISHKIMKRGDSLVTLGETLKSVSMKEAGDSFLKFLSELQKPILVCHGNDWVTLFNNLDGDFQGTGFFESCFQP